MKPKPVNPETIRLLEYCGWRGNDQDGWFDPQYESLRLEQKERGGDTWLEHIHPTHEAREIQIARDKERRNQTTGDSQMTTAVAPYTVDDKETVAQGQASRITQLVESLPHIDTDEQFTLAGEYLKQCAKGKSIIEAETESIKTSAYQNWKGICDKIKGWVAPLEKGEKHFRDIRADYQRRIAEENARAQAEAARLQREAEEAAAKKHAAEVKKAEKKGIDAPPPPVVAPVVMAPILREAPKTEGVSQREVWRAEVFDLMALAKAVVEGKIGIDYILPNDKLLTANVKVLKDKMNVPGVRAKRDYGDTVRT